MSDLTDKFNTFEEQVATEHTAIMSAIADMQTALDLINSQLDTININGAVNARALLSALGQTGACFPCPSPSIVVPVVPSDDVTMNEELCQRVQGMLQTLHDILDAMDVMQSFNVIGTFNVVNDAISEVIAGITAGDTVPLPSFPETVNIVGDYVSYAGERLFSGVGLVEQFDPLHDDLQAAMFGAGTASGAQAAYNTLIDGSSVSNGAKLLFKAVAYNALWSYYFDPSSMPDVSGFDGTLCGVVDCRVIDAIPVNYSDASGVFSIEWPSDIPAHNSLPSGYSADHNVWTIGSLLNWTFTATGNVRVFEGGGHLDLTAGAGYTFASGTDCTINSFAAGNEAFSITLCPPGS